MTNQPIKSTFTAGDLHELAAGLVGARIANRYAFAALALAMQKHKGLDLADVFTLIRPIAAVFAASAKAATDPLNAQAMTIAMEEIAAIEPTIMNMVTPLAGAGHA